MNTYGIAQKRTLKHSTCHPYSKVPLSNNTLVQWNITSWSNTTPLPPHQTLLSELLLLPMSRQAATPHGGHLFRCVISWTLVDKYRMSQMPKEISNKISWKRIFFVAYRHVYSFNHTGATWGSSVQMFDVMHSSFLENGVSMLWSAKMGKRGFSFRQSFLAGRGNQEEWWVNLHILILGVYQW